MGVKDQMIGILRDRDTARIQFSYSRNGRSATVNVNVFQRVANDLEHDRLHVVEGYNTGNRITYSSWSEADRNANTFYLGENPRWSRDFNALVIHESIHAYFDVTSTEMPWLHNEAIAYIAQGFYLRNSGYPQARLEEDEPYELGYRAARDIASGESGSAWITLLVDKLNTDPRYSSYIHTNYTGDG